MNRYTYTKGISLIGLRLKELGVTLIISSNNQFLDKLSGGYKEQFNLF